MSKIDYQTLREIAKQATQGEWVAFISSGTGTYAVHTPGDKRCEDVIKWTGFDGQNNAENNARYIAAFNPEVVQALLDERERNQQYIKSRDQENEDIALTVGKLRVELEAAKKRIAELEAEPVSQTYNLPELIEGMEVSIDVSTCDADFCNRYFGTVTEALELDTAKNGYILLVQDAEPNFDVNGNSPVTQDGWINCSDRMPEIRQTVIGWNGYAVRQCVYTRNEYAKTQKGREPRFETLTGIWHGVTHWMPLPEPPQGVNRG
ncbi:ead/Ea22-like family protein [Escherichia coli]|uniref:ead/Ea22-like family protein n=2 Tax=Escherichia coli TaxID=562 RepID=UPI003CF66BC3